MPPSEELCPDGEGDGYPLGAGYWIDETKSTCYANQFEYLDKRPLEEQVGLNTQVEICLEHCDLRIHNENVKIESNYIRRWKFYLGVVGAGILGILTGTAVEKLRN